MACGREMGNILHQDKVCRRGRPRVTDEVKAAEEGKAREVLPPCTQAYYEPC